MARLNWNIVHECDDDNGNPTQWAAEINHPDYGRFVWIDDEGEKFGVYSGKNCNTKLAECKSLASAKRWVATYIF